LLYQYLLQIRQSWFSGAQESVSRLSARRSFEEEPAGERWADDDFHCRKVGAPQPPVTRIIGAPQPSHLRRILPDSHLENTATGWSFSSFIAAIVAAHSSRGSKASDFASDKLSDIRYDLDRAVVLALRLEEAEVAPQIDQGGALVVQFELDALDSARTLAPTARCCPICCTAMRPGYGVIRLTAASGR
jgi:hypothetical protein